MIVFALAAANDEQNGVMLVLTEVGKEFTKIAKVRGGPLLSPPWV
jgi:hypothetical protein